MTALPAEQPLELDSAQIYRLPPREDVPNPILDASLGTLYEPPPDAVLNRPKQKRARKAKGTGKRPGRPPRTKTPEVEAPTAPAQPLIATPPHGDARPNRRRIDPAMVVPALLGALAGAVAVLAFVGMFRVFTGAW